MRNNVPNGCEEPKRQSKRAEIDSLLNQVANYTNETRSKAEDISITLLQERAIPDAKSGLSRPGEVLQKDPNSMGWFDTVIKRLLNIKHNLERTGGHLSKLHREVVIK